MGLSAEAQTGTGPIKLGTGTPPSADNVARKYTLAELPPSAGLGTTSVVLGDGLPQRIHLAINLAAERIDRI